MIIKYIIAILLFSAIILFHELGHFLAFMAGNMDTGSKFSSVYSSEKGMVTGYNKAYVTRNASEYFAESVKDYMLNPGSLEAQRPNTYKAIEKALSMVTEQQIELYKGFY